MAYDLRRDAERRLMGSIPTGPIPTGSILTGPILTGPIPTGRS